MTSCLTMSSTYLIARCQEVVVIMPRMRDDEMMDADVSGLITFKNEHTKPSERLVYLMTPLCMSALYPFAFSLSGF